MTDLKLLALEDDDLPILSAHCQDAVIRGEDIRYLPHERRFVLVMNRFVWEAEGQGKRFGFSFRREHERRRAVLHFDRVTGVQSRGVAADDPQAILVLLAVTFTPGDAPSGSIDLVFAGGSEIRLGVECIEAQLTDVGGAWSTPSRPDHARDETDLLR